MENGEEVGGGKEKEEGRTAERKEEHPLEDTEKFLTCRGW